MALGRLLIRGTIADDSITGTIDGDYIVADKGNDRINGNSGHDVIFGDHGNDTIFGANGDDEIYGGFGNDAISGGNGNDTISGDSGDDRIIGGDGNDTIFGKDGDDVVRAGNGDDRIYDGSGKDVLYGEAGNDYLEAVSYTVSPTSDRTVLYGGDGDDRLVSKADRDGNVLHILNGDAGNDRLSVDMSEYGTSLHNHTAKLTGGTGADSFQFDLFTTGTPYSPHAPLPVTQTYTITDFNVAEDHLWINTKLDNSPGGRSLVSNHAAIESVNFTADGSTVLHTYTGGGIKGTITLVGVDATEWGHVNFSA